MEVGTGTTDTNMDEWLEVCIPSHTNFKYTSLWNEIFNFSLSFCFILRLASRLLICGLCTGHCIYSISIQQIKEEEVDKHFRSWFVTKLSDSTYKEIQVER